MKINIFTEGGHQAGLGHISRCSSLYNELIRLGHDVDFYIQGDIDGVSILSNLNVFNLNWLSTTFLKENIQEGDYCIVDSYNLTEILSTTISDRSIKTLYIDDTVQLNYSKGLVVNPSLSANFFDYPIHKEVEYLLGPEYIILREIFQSVSPPQSKKHISRILITIGGTDIRNLIPTLVDNLCKRLPLIHFDVLIGTNKHNHTLLQEVTNCTFHNNLTDVQVQKLMSDADIAITATGQTIYELISTATPFIPIQVIDNQKYVTESIMTFSLADSVLHWDDINLTENIYNAIIRLKSYDIRCQYSKLYRHLIDGQGSKRIVDILLR